ncbi:hypothetical protein [Aporhodopirellula aestuarii]|uniref:Uncharacterized protein n=1 Tax=Aporhodopirellula aestuarii TaxID=2950107 RepID=A0ABT0U6K0_9BACT|nr:hypothetical protein [Aporhodopirellula aestuarii]MCM2371951.1 hypothetical protein [Aporhodopirellula aestuarii]
MQNAENARRVLNDRIEMEIDLLDQVTPLKEPQKEMIRLAGKGDIARFLNEVDRAVQEFKIREANGANGQQAVNELYQLAMPLQQRLNKGLFNKDSLLRKVARTAIDEHQAVELRKREAEQAKRKVELAYATFVANLGRQVPMTMQQRDALMDLLRDKAKINNTSGPYVAYVVMVKLSEMPEAQIKAIFDEPQSKAIQSTFAQAAAIKQSLTQMGAWDE